MFFPTCCEGAAKLVVYQDGKWIMDCDGHAIEVTTCPICGSKGFTKKNNHQIFLERLDKSQRAVWAVAFWIMQFNKKSVVLHPTEFAPTASEQLKYVDKGDLDVVDNMDPFESRVVNVKQLTYDFTDRASWPFKDMIVTACHAFDNAKRHYNAYIFVNPDSTHLAFVNTETKDQWWIETRGDKGLNGDYEQKKYICSPDLAKFYEMRLDGIGPQRLR